ncbi:MAG: hypothetical protein RM021_009790 [Nostoc sp. EkiNYC01]|nr:hypothetical protein [Nostoc sp. EkiNYC01]
MLNKRLLTALLVVTTVATTVIVNSSSYASFANPNQVGQATDDVLRGGRSFEAKARIIRIRPPRPPKPLGTWRTINKARQEFCKLFPNRCSRK